ncbi:hypothetical protein B0H34DRAFT_666911 [Crassisporium funariophilum]|nr:hypothetical protein B0H34DRAFT_666911 [Crassisporium funariophilum]
MSYLMSTQRAYDQQPPQNNPNTNQGSRIQMAAPSIHQSYPQQQPILSTSPSASQNTHYAPDHSPQVLPKVGQTRCYWAMLSSDLQFIYLDPVLASHLEEQAEVLVGKSLLSFVHPDEQASAKQDLGGVLESRTLHGSVTRVRFSRLSKVRRQLGYEGPPPNWSEADKIAFDKDYMAVDIVINWAAEGLVLCFIHAIVDLNPSDNDEGQKTEWTNWCGTPFMPVEQVELLYRRLLGCIPQSGSMSRVFQILANQREKVLLMSWPPDSAQGPTSREFSKLVENVQIGSGVPGGNDAKTSCTRRYKALQDMPVFGGEVESIFIPHGTIIFACHKVNSTPRSSASASAPMQQLGYASANYNTQTPSYYEQAGSYALPPLSPQSQSYNNSFIAQQQGPGVQAPYSPQRWAQAPLPNGLSNLRSGSYPPSAGSQPSQGWPQGPASSSYLETGTAAAFDRSLSPSYNYSPTAASSAGASPTSDVVPPPRRRISPGSSRDQVAPARAAGNRPMGVQKCSSCKATSSPEWRKGPSGKKELCNACGLRYARSRAKKEGPNPAQQQRRRKEKGLSKRESATPPTSASGYSAIRRNYADSSFSTSSAGSASGSDIYPHSGHHMLDTMTPSPSPPASNMNFVHYAPGGVDNRPPPPYSGTASTFYNVPSPLSNPSVLHPQEQQQHMHVNQLPPLGQLSTYAGRLSPMVPTGSPITHSSLTSTIPPASYERERERERDMRDLPPTPLSAEPRHARRSILTQQ